MDFSQLGILTSDQSQDPYSVQLFHRFQDFGKDYNLGLCLIEKCASTLNVGINCFVKKGEFFERLGIKISDGWSKTR